MARRVAAIQRLTVATTALKTVNLRDFLKNFHFIPSRFADTLRQTKSTTFTVVYEYVCVYRRDEAVRSARKKPHTWLAHSPLLQYPLYHNHSRQTLRLNIKLYCRGQGDERDGISISTWGAEKFNVAYNRHHSRSYVLYTYESAPPKPFVRLRRTANGANSIIDKCEEGGSYFIVIYFFSLSSSVLSDYCNHYYYCRRFFWSPAFKLNGLCLPLPPTLP